ncbi:MAG: hypothetical protein AABX71_00925 [Nanoarchaeota archaeon]
MNQRSLREVLDDDSFEEPYKVTNRTRSVSQRAAQQGFGASVRLATGRVYTDEEYDKRREEVLSTPLP